MVSEGTEHRLDRDGTRLSCREWGSGDPCMVLVHGLAGSHRHFSVLAAGFSADRRVVAVDLRGHGASAGPVPAPAIDTYASDVAWLCGRLGVDGAVVVGHSMGGHVAAQLARDHPERVSALVFLDSSLLWPPEQLPAVRALVDALHGARYRDAIEAFARGLFGPADDPERRERIVEDFRSLPQDVLAPSAAAVAAWSAADVLPRCRVPALYVAARPRPELLADLRELLPEMHAAQVVGSGHFPHLEVPEQVAPMIQRFLKISGLAGR